jgi:hypothetical protein
VQPFGAGPANFSSWRREKPKQRVPGLSLDKTLTKTGADGKEVSIFVDEKLLSRNCPRD